MSKTHAPNIGMVMENGEWCFYAYFISLHWKVFSNENYFYLILLPSFSFASL